MEKGFSDSNVKTGESLNTPNLNSEELLQSLDSSASELTAEDLEYYQMDKECRILMDKYYAPKEYIFNVNGISFISIGDIHLIQAQAKQGKSTLVTILVATCLCGKLGALEYILKRKITIVVFDTEQFESDTHKQLTMMHELGEDNNGSEVLMYNLRKRGFGERYKFVKETIIRKKPTFVVIDGIRDLIPDINDSVGCPMLVQELMQLASEVGCAIICVLHNNPSDGKARGWIGTELINKCAYSIELEKPGSVVTVKTPITRGAPVPQWQFTFGADGKPTFDLDFIAHRQKVDKAVEESSKAAMAKAKRQNEINLVIDQLKKVGGKMKRSDFVDKMTNEGTFKKSHLQELIKVMIESENIPLMTADSFIFVNANSTTENVSDENIPIF
ncbi:MAG: AAA family ATPase [Prevotellaceae bacterium]|nr:AAA family ATPase [Prevotellaceae bacterium]